MKTFVLKIKLILFLSFIAISIWGQKFEAEDATLSGGAQIKSSTTNSGTGYVEQRGGGLTFDVELEEESYYNIFIHASSPGGKKTNDFVINDASISFTLEQNNAFESSKVVSYLKLAKGKHTIKIRKNYGWINIDYIYFETVNPTERFNISTSLVTPNPTDEATRLYQFLYDNYGKKIISGTMTLKSMDEINWLKSNTGKEPALLGLDFMFCGQNYSWYNDEEPINDAKNFYNRNGIPVFCWHWKDPSGRSEAFYTKDSDFDVSKISDKNSDEYMAMVRDIDYISGLIKKLQDNGIPILWRPLHEASGGWFWWGAKGPEPCKTLYRLIYDRMVNYHGLRNIIWIWTSQQNDMSWYPGDEYVDIIGRDIYKEGDHTSQILEFNKLNSDYGGKKMITLSECGSFPDADNLVKDEVPWSYYMPWYGSYVRESKHNSLDLWKKMFAHEYVLTLDKMPELKSYTTPDPNAWRSKLYPENWKPGYSDGAGRFLHDFSYAGYHQGEKEIPCITNNIVDVTQTPYNVDNTGEQYATAGIQKALDDVGASGGGVVYLPAGMYKVNPGTGTNALQIKNSNTVLRGAGKDSTYIYNDASIMRQKNIIYVMDDWCTWATEYGEKSKLTMDLLYPTQIIPVESVANFEVGDEIILRTNGTPEFIEEHKMSGIWTEYASRVMFHRIIDSIDVENNLIYIDSPTRYFMKMRDNARVYHAKPHIREVGIEDLSIGNIQNNKTGWGEESYTTSGTGAYDVHASHAIYFKYAYNCWIKNVNTFKPENNTEDIHVLSNCLLIEQSRGVTADSCFFQKSQYEGGGGNGYMFTLSANDCLIKNSRANDGRHNYDFKHGYSNGNVIHNCIGENSKYSSDFHMYLSMSNLFDVTTVDKDYLESTFRPYGGTVIHGYSSTQSVFYNTHGKAYHPKKDYIIESKQFGHGYVIGTSGAASKVILDPVQGSKGGYEYNTSPRDFAEGIGKGADLVPQSLYLDQLERRLCDTTGIQKFNVTIVTKNAQNEQVIQDCTVELMKDSKHTNLNGEACFWNVNGLLVVNISKNNFYPISNKQYTIYCDTTLTFLLVPQEYNVTLVVCDKETGNTFEGSQVIFNDKTEVSNNKGEVHFLAYEGSFNYEIIKTSYTNLSGTLSIKSDTTINFYLQRSSAYIKFKLKEGTTPVNKATIILNNDTLVTTGLGIANFKNLSVNEQYSYKIYKGGYNDLFGNISLKKDTTVSIQMDAYPTSGSKIGISDKIKVWPNPVSTVLKIEFPEYLPDGKIEIRNLNGMLLQSIAFENKKSERINVSLLKAGTYLLSISSSNSKYTILFMKE